MIATTVTSGISQYPYLKLSFKLFEELEAAARGWDLSFRQLGPSDQPYLLEQVISDRMIYNRSFFSSRFHQKGGSPPGCRTFTLLARGSREFRWCGELITSDVLLVMPDSGEFESMSPPGLDLFHISLDRVFLEQAALQHFDCDLHEILDRERALCQHGGEHLRQLRNLLHRLSRDIPVGMGVGVPGMPADAEHSIASLLLRILQQGTVAPRGARNRRMRALSNALKILDANERIGVPALVEAIGVSRRTLETAFQDILSISPAAYIKARQLQQLRADLLAAHPSASSVAHLARVHGFAHGGQLAIDYRDLFGELPSATLRR